MCAHAARLDHIIFSDQGEERTGQVMAGPFTIPLDTGDEIYYYVVESDGTEILVNHDNMMECTPWTL